MSLFQCDKCGCIDNTALSAGYRIRLWARDDKATEFKNLLGLSQDQPLGKYCCVCSPFNPREWHNKFERKFYPIGTMETDEQGNIRKKQE